MKIAIVSDDNQTVSQHFGRAKNYIVISLTIVDHVEKLHQGRPGR